MKYLLLCLLFILVGRDTKEERVTWNEERRLTWSDFKDQPDTNSDAVALTASGITFGYSVKTSGERIIGFTTSVEAHFYPNKSWYIKDKGNAYILGHEQLHFDITELYVRKFRKEIEKLVVNQNLKEQMKRLHIAINEALNETQKRYDTQSVHSINTEMQKKWEAFIKEELIKLSQYKSQ